VKHNPLLNQAPRHEDALREWMYYPMQSWLQH